MDMRDVRVGDIVLVRKPENVSVYPFWAPEMDKYQSRCLTVKSTDGDVFEAIETGSWVFSVSWIAAIPTYSGRCGEIIPDLGPTLLDQFAMAALTGFLSGNLATHDQSAAEITGHAYWFARAMMVEREKGD